VQQLSLLRGSKGLVVSFSERVAIPTDVLIRELDGESVALNLDSERYFGLDEVGTRMVMCLSEADSIQTAYEMLLAEYDVDPDTLRQDLQTLIEDLLAHGLVEIKPQ
jgi:hypothetical protein